MLKVIASIAAIASIMAFILTAVISTMSLRGLFRYLKQVHPGIWHQLGEPSLWAGQWTTGSPASKFISLHQYREVPDPELQILGRRAKNTSNALAVSFASFVVSVLFCSII